MYASVIRLPAARPPTAVVVNEKVAETFALAANRSLAATKNATPVTGHPIHPDAIAKDGIASALVDKITPDSLPSLAKPMVRPISVTTKVVLAGSVVPEILMTIKFAVGGPMGVKEVPLKDTAPNGVVLEAKKPDR